MGFSISFHILFLLQRYHTFSKTLATELNINNSCAKCCFFCECWRLLMWTIQMELTEKKALTWIALRSYFINRKQHVSKLIYLFVQKRCSKEVHCKNDENHQKQQHRKTINKKPLVENWRHDEIILKKIQ